jgi:hypothetical protein
MLVLALAIVAIGCLVAGLVDGHVGLVWAALASSVSGVVLMLFVWLRSRARRPAMNIVDLEGHDHGLFAGHPHKVRAASLAAGRRELAPQPRARGADDVRTSGDHADGARLVDRADDNGMCTEKPEVKSDASADEKATARVNLPRDNIDRDPDPDRDVLEGRVAQKQTGGNHSPVMRTVHVVPGRRRFHTGECRLLASRVTEEISEDEALDEGFSACTVCGPGPGPELEPHPLGGGEVSDPSPS